MKALLLVFIVCCSSSLVFGQEGLIKPVGTTAQEKANAQDFNTTRNNKERGGSLIDNKKSSPAPASAPASSEQAVPAPVEAETPGEHQPAYTFTSRVSYSIESAKKPGESQTIHYDFGDKVIQMASNADMTSIMDSKNGVMIMLNNKEKTAMVMSTQAMEAAMKQQMNQAEKPAAKVTKTGRKKTILGYQCEEILIESEGKKTEVWIAKGTGIDVSNTFANMNKAGASQIPNEAFSEGGMLLEMNGYDAAGKLEVHLVATALSKDSKTVNIGTYKITKL